MTVEQDMIEMIRLVFGLADMFQLVPVDQLSELPAGHHELEIGQYWLFWTGRAALEPAVLRGGEVLSYAKSGKITEMVISTQDRTVISIRYGGRGC